MKFNLFFSLPAVKNCSCSVQLVTSDGKSTTVNMNSSYLSAGILATLTNMSRKSGRSSSCIYYFSTTLVFKCSDSNPYSVNSLIIVVLNVVLNAYLISLYASRIELSMPSLDVGCFSTFSYSVELSFFLSASCRSDFISQQMNDINRQQMIVRIIVIIIILVSMYLMQ